MDPTRPAKVDPRRFVASIKRYGVTYSFGSPAIWNVVSRYCLAEKIVLPSLKKVLMAGAPVPGELIERMKEILPEDAEIHTPYGATESLPIVSMEGAEILASTWRQSRKGMGTCVGRALPGIDIRIIRIDDDPLPEYSLVEELPAGEIGEIIVRGDVVTRAYENNVQETRSAKIHDGQTFWHRMGDVGYLDGEKRLWFCGRKAHRVQSAAGTLFTIPCEAIVNEHPAVFRSALVGIAKDANGWKEPAMIVEPHQANALPDETLLRQIREIAGENRLTKDIRHFLVHSDFPVDIRHNAKIFREKLAVWAENKVRRG
jgi:acyl-CoA synthetase (AMP-forming)/AMP-acid ligase II